jgi:hypothetical protein
MGREIVKEENGWDISFLFEIMWPKYLSDPPQEDCLFKPYILLI